MKKNYIYAICAAMICTMLAGCGASDENENLNVQFTAAFSEEAKTEAQTEDTKPVTQAEKKETKEVTERAVTTVTEAVTSETTAAQTEETTVSETAKPAEETNAPEETKQEEQKEEKPADNNEENSDYSFTFEGHTVTMGKDLSGFVSSCTPEDSIHSKSCLGNGEDYMYTYSHFTLNGYEENGSNIAVSLDFTDSEVSTAKNIRIGSSKDELISAYGSNYTEESSEYVYRDGKSTLRFRISDDAVAGVSYNYDI